MVQESIKHFPACPACRQAGLTTETSQGMNFDPLTQSVKGEVSC